jgi:mannose-6-phosphate isomerase-like protein (cupin superfamily)
MAKGHMNWVPPGQGSPWHSVPRDLIFFVLDGRVEISAANTTYDLLPCDLLLVRADTPFAYRNPGNADAFYFDGGGPVRQLEATNVYYESDPRWPVDPTVAVTFTRRNGITRAAAPGRE